MRSKTLLPLVAIGAGFLCALEAAPADEPALRWVAIGDSYTKGEAASADEAWPARAAAKLREENIRIELVKNLGVTGATSREVLEDQVPELASLSPDLVTVQVGINDWVRRRGEERFRADLADLLDGVIARVGTASRVVAVDIPDFSVAAMAPRFADPGEIHEALVRRNAIIDDVAAKKRVAVAHVFEKSRAAIEDRSLLARDGIHPSGKGYGAWVEDVMPALRGAVGKVRR